MRDHRDGGRAELHGHRIGGIVKVNGCFFVVAARLVGQVVGNDNMPDLPAIGFFHQVGVAFLADV